MHKLLKWAVWIILLVPVVYLVVVWKKMPARIAMHFDIHGNADQFDNKNEFLLFIGIMTLVGIGIYFLLTNIYRIDPKKYAADNKERLRKIAFAVVAFLCAIECFIISIAVEGSMKLNTRFLFALIGVFWAIIGNYMNNLKPNYFAGFRLPWTLENEENWRYTHHLASKLWFAGGLLIAAVCLLSSNIVATVALFAISLTIIIIPIIFSYRHFKKQKTAGTAK